jgi:hypothetical protein
MQNSLVCKLIFSPSQTGRIILIKLFQNYGERVMVLGLISIKKTLEYTFFSAEEYIILKNGS